jgi:inhibitor of cysteine peptidase
MQATCWLPRRPNRLAAQGRQSRRVVVLSRWMLGLIVVLAWLSLGCVAPKKEDVGMHEVVLSQSQSGTTVNVNPGDVVVVSLPENPTTGYRWAIDDVDSTVLELENSEITRAGDTSVGSGGQRILRFTAKAPGTTRLLLKNWREWQGDSSIVDRFDATVQVAS